MERELAALERHVARFERRTRLMWFAGLAAAVIVVVFWGGARQAQSQATALRVREIDLVDPSNHPRIVLGTDTSNRPAIGMLDDAGKERLRFGFGTQPATPIFYLQDETGRAKLQFGSNIEHSDSQVTMSDPSGTARVFFGFGVQLRTPQFALNDERGKDRIYAGWLPTRAATVSVLDGSGNIIWRGGTAGSAGGPPKAP
ncbi:MAG TPA: hypothetical protein VJT33_10145 [bacterium]|nr:hypothetical protein [bacterium]